MLPSFLRFVTKYQMDRSYRKFRQIFIPIIKERRKDCTAGQAGLTDFMPFILSVVDDDDRASDLVTISVWIGLRYLQIVVASTLLDIITTPGLAKEVRQSSAEATVAQLDTFGKDLSRNTPWSLLRSSMFESIRLCGPITGPARIICSEKPLALASDPSVHLPPGQVATLSSYYSHRASFNYEDAETYKPKTFVSHDPDIGSTRFITWGLQGPHTCPGRWYAQELACVLVRAVLQQYDFPPEGSIPEDQRYIYHAGVVTRRETPVLITKV